MERTAFVCVAELKLQNHQHLSSGILELSHTLLPSPFLSVLIYPSSRVILETLALNESNWSL